MKSVLILTGLFPEQIRTEIVENSKYNTQFAADALQWSMLKGLSYFIPNLKVINSPFIGAYPFLYRKITTSEFSFAIKETDINGYNIKYWNLIGVKNIFIYKKVKNHVNNWCKETKGNKVIIIYSTYLPFMKAASQAKKRYSNTEICLILPDLPKDSNNFSYWIYKLYGNYYRQKAELYLKSIDFFVLLSKHMADFLQIPKKNWVVVEGIFDPIVNKDMDNTLEVVQKEKVILYTGTLHKKYGILNLIEAFKLIKDNSLRLVIYGNGDAQLKVHKAQFDDNRILYKGTIDRNALLREQRMATLLVNPRTNEGEFTKFSFPSKTMEYFASGSPTLIYKLDGIPEEYYDYCFTLEGNSIIELSEKIVKIINMSDMELKQIGNRARRFVLDLKNPKVQCEKIYNLIMKSN